jgi:hypothetical protein
MNYYNDMRPIFPWIKMRRYRVPLGPSVTFFAARAGRPHHHYVRIWFATGTTAQQADASVLFTIQLMLSVFGQQRRIEALSGARVTLGDLRASFHMMAQ